MAVASASENADTVLERLEIRNRFDYVARAKEIKRGKPDPEIFLLHAPDIWGFCQTVCGNRGCPGRDRSN